MARLNVTSYKNTLIKAIIFNNAIVDLIDSQSSNYDPDASDSLIYNNIFPYLHVPNSQTKADTYILFSVSYINQNRINSLFMDVRVLIRILAHQNRMRVKGISGNRIDHIAKELTQMLDGSTAYGVGTLELISDVEEILNADYQYRDLSFRAVDLPQSFCS